MPLLCAGVACAPASEHGARVLRSTSTTSAAAPTTASAAPEHGHGKGSATTRPLDAARRSSLGLPAPGEAPDPLPPLSDDQWGDPQAVAARYVLVDTNYPASDDPAAVAARRSAYAAERLRADLVTSSSAAAGLEQLRRQGAVFTGEVLGLATDAADATSATITVTVRRSILVDGRPAETPRVVFYRLILVRAPATGHWQVADVSVS